MYAAGWGDVEHCAQETDSVESRDYLWTVILYYILCALVLPTSGITTVWYVHFCTVCSVCAYICRNACYNYCTLLACTCHHRHLDCQGWSALDPLVRVTQMVRVSRDARCRPIVYLGQHSLPCLMAAILLPILWFYVLCYCNTPHKAQNTANLPYLKLSSSRRW